MDLVTEWRMTRGIEEQTKAFLDGFNEVKTLKTKVPASLWILSYWIRMLNNGSGSVLDIRKFSQTKFFFLFF